MTFVKWKLTKTNYYVETLTKTTLKRYYDNQIQQTSLSKKVFLLHTFFFLFALVRKKPYTK